MAAKRLLTTLSCIPSVSGGTVSPPVTRGSLDETVLEAPAVEAGRKAEMLGVEVATGISKSSTEEEAGDDEPEAAADDSTDADSTAEGWAASSEAEAAASVSSRCR